MPKQLCPLKLSKRQKQSLLEITRKRNIPAKKVMRSRIILLANGAMSNAQISRQLMCSEHTVGNWRKRWEKDKWEGLEDQPKSGRPRKIKLSKREQVVRIVCQAPPRHLSRWTVRLLSKETGVPKSEIQRILSEYDLKPHRLRSFTFSPDPQFKEKLLNVVGLYMSPPKNAVILCVDEKTGIQALDRTQPMLPLRAKKPRSWTNEYVRHGTRTLLASLDIKTGEVVAHVRKRRTSKDFLAFMDEVSRKYKGKRLCVILDNLNTHNNKSAQVWLAAHPNISFHFTPTHASWVNLIEVFFSILTRQGLQQCVHKSVRQLESFLKRYIQKYNERCGPFEWTAGPTRLKKIIKLTMDFQTQVNM